MQRSASGAASTCSRPTPARSQRYRCLPGHGRPRLRYRSSRPALAARIWKDNAIGRSWSTCATSHLLCRARCKGLRCLARLPAHECMPSHSRLRMRALPSRSQQLLISENEQQAITNMHAPIAFYDPPRRFALWHKHLCCDATSNTATGHKARSHLPCQPRQIVFECDRGHILQK